ncbi:MAG: hypothetical protein AAF757_03195 [Cyanobacteria bacterium P01_D01_bin.116]
MQAQLGKNILNANEISGLHIGDRTYYGKDTKTIKTIKIVILEALSMIIVHD